MKQTAQRRGTSTPQKTTTKFVKTMGIYKVIAPAKMHLGYIIRYVVASSEKHAIKKVLSENSDAVQQPLKCIAIRKTK